MISFKDTMIFDPEKRNREWAQEYVTYLRMNATCFVNATEAAKSRTYLLSEQDMANVRSLFGDPKKANVQFAPTMVMDKIRNVLTAELKAAGISITTNAIDPSANNDRKKDRELLENRNDMEAFLTSMRSSINMPGFNLKNEVDENGDSHFKGNIDKFDEMGLDSNQPEDLDFFFTTHYRLLAEIEAEKPINHVLRASEAHRMIPLWLDDILAVRAVAARVYVNTTSGATELFRIMPEAVKGIWGNRLDGKDATAILHEENISVAKFLQRVGDDFDYRTDMEDLLYAVNYCSKTDLQFIPNDTGGAIYNRANMTYVSGYNFLQYQLTLGYVEWKSINGKAYKATNKNYHGNVKVHQRSLGGEGAPDSTYKRIINYDEVTEKAYYIIKSNTAQKMYCWGPLEYVQLEGGNDELSNFSFCLSKGVGKSAVQIALPQLNIIDKMEAKFESILNKVRPPGRGFHYGALKSITEKLIGSGNTKQDVTDTVKMFIENNFELYDSVVIGGNAVGGTAQPNYDIPNDKIYGAFQFFDNGINRQEARIRDKLGITPLRDGSTMQPRDVYGLQMESLQSSKNATQYMSDLLMEMMVDVGQKIVYYTQAIVNFRTVNEKPYKYLLQALGEQTVADIKSLGKVALHRFSIFVEPFNAAYDKQMLQADAQLAFQQAQITYEQLLLIRSIESPKVASRVLAYEKQKTEKKAMAAEQQKSDMQLQVANQKHANDMELQQLKNAGDLAAKNAEGEWYFKAHNAIAQATIDKQELKSNADSDKIEQKKNADLEKINASKGSD